MTKHFRRALLLLCLLPGLPAPAQTTLPAPAVVFTPAPPKTVVFTPAPPAPTLASLQNSVATFQSQITALTAQVTLTAPTIYGQPFVNRYSDSSPSGPHLFFPHFQTANGDYGKSYNAPPYNALPGGGTDYSTSPSVTQARQDVDEAAGQGADGFSLDVQGNTNAYASTVENDFTAADQYNAQHAGQPNAMGVTNFTPFLTFDFSTFPETPSVIEAYILRSIKHPSYYRYKGLPFVSCYAGEGGGYSVVKSVWQPVIAALKAQGVNIYFVPGFNPTDPSGNYLSGTFSDFVENATGSLLQIPAQGAWWYTNGLGIAASPNHTTLFSQANMAQAEGMFGLSYMAAVGTGWQQYDKTGHTYNDYEGFETLDGDWRGVLALKNAFWVQYLTWNDFGEYSRLTNANANGDGPWPYIFHSNQLDFYKSTLGQQAINRYYVQWYKTGVQPSVTNDNLFAVYRTQPASLDVPGDEGNKITYTVTDSGEGGGLSLLSDTFFVTTILPSPALLTVTNGGQTFKKTVPAGECFSRLGPFLPGSVTMTLSRNGVVTTTLTGHAILGAASVYNWSDWSGYAHD